MLDFIQNFPLFMIILPMVTSAIVTVVKSPKVAKAITLTVQSVIIVLSVILLVYLINSPTQTFNYMMGHFPAPFGNELRIGVLEALLSSVFLIILFFSVNGAPTEVEEELAEGKHYLYYMMINLMSVSLNALLFTNDIFTAYVFIEINTIVSCSLILMKRKGPNFRAANKYLTMSSVGSGLFLLASAIIYSITGHLLIEFMHTSVVELVKNGQYIFPLTVSLVLYTIALINKAGLFPFHTWLPDAHGSSVTSASSILSSLVLKVYIFLLIKIFYRLYGLDVVADLGIGPILVGFGIAAMIFGSIVAISQKDAKRMAAYSSVAQMGYIFMGIGIGTELGYMTAVFHIIVHAITKSAVFLSLGSLIRTVGSKKLADLKGAAKYNKVAAISFTISALSMVGVPLFAGFSSKLLYGQALFSSNSTPTIWLGMIGLAISSFLNVVYFIPVVISLFSGNSELDKKPIKKAQVSTQVILAILGVANIVVGVFYNQLTEIILIGLDKLG